MVPYQVTSDPTGAQVDINGTTAGNTPLTIELQCSKTFVGYGNSPTGYVNATGTYTIVVYPAKGMKGYSQTKRVDPCQYAGDYGKINFNLELDPVLPKERIEINQ